MTNFFQYYCMNRVTHIKSLNDFCNILLKHKKESIFEFKEDLMTLVQSSLIEDLINLELEVIKNKGLYAPVPASFAHITIFDSPLYSLYIYSKSVNDLKTLTHCSTHASDRIVIPLNENGFIGDFFTQSDPYPVDILDKSKKLSIVKQDHSFKKNEPILLEKNKDILSYSSKNKETMYFLGFYSKLEGQYVWEYSLKTLLPEKIVAGNYQSTSRLEQACTLLGELGSPKSLPYLFKMLNHSEFNVKWESAKAIMLIDFEKGLEALRLLKGDRHPEIIKAVDKSLRQLTNLNLI